MVPIEQKDETRGAVDVVVRDFPRPLPGAL